MKMIVSKDGRNERYFWAWDHTIVDESYISVSDKDNNEVYIHNKVFYSYEIKQAVYFDESADQ
jgi:6-phosphogluconolactonase/glucosamine-6-phosphate isomerase/deaminase